MKSWKVSELEELPACMGFLWSVYFRVFDNGKKVLCLNYPLCPNCRTRVEVNNSARKAVCINPDCGKQFKFKTDFEKIRQIVHEKYEAHLRSGKKVVALDLPLGIVEAKSDDENYWIFARIGQKNGKKMGVVWMGEKLKNQKPTDKVQFFVDFDDEQIRFDKTNMSPMKLLSKMSIEFEKSVTEINKK